MYGKYEFIKPPVESYIKNHGDKIKDHMFKLAEFPDFPIFCSRDVITGFEKFKGLKSGFPGEIVNTLLREMSEEDDPLVFRLSKKRWSFTGKGIQKLGEYRDFYGRPSSV